ncbi:MAG TPA: cytochrome c [Candidatus Bathyarchaeia archaeon]|nr:cytochrome c [Candidatus Bathyarchaeia archaeon]
MDPQPTLATATPVPHDLPLPLPVGREVLQVLIVVFFLLHILFVNLMVGGSLLAFGLEWMGLRRPEYDRLARRVAATITVNKSLAVVLGVGPLLSMNLLYTVYFYAANALTGIAWVMVLPMIAGAFLLAYAHKYSWDRLARHKALHLALAGMALLLFLAVPLVFLANANTMLFPERWAEVRGFFSTLLLPNVLPRYLHFLLSSVAVTGLFLAGYLGRARFPVETALSGFTRARLRRGFYTVTLVASALQFVAGPLLYFTLPTRGVTAAVTVAVAGGAVCAALAMWLLVQEVLAADERVGQRYGAIVSLLALTVLAMGSGRHFYREAQLAPHRAMVEEKTARYRALVAEASAAAASAGRLGAAEDGSAVYGAICVACHQAKGEGLPGTFPPLAASEWVNAPRPDRLIRIVLYGLAGPIQVKGVTFPGAVAMPGQKDTLSDEKIAAVLTYIRGAWGNGGGPVRASDVARARKEAGRSQAWTAAELQLVPDR